MPAKTITVTVTAEGFRRALGQVLRAASSERDGGVLRGVLVEATGNSVRFVATDKHRLAVSDLRAVGRSGAAFAVVLEATTLAELLDERLDAAADGDVVLTVDAGVASVATGGRSVEVAVLAGDFPDHRAVLRGITGDGGGVPLIADRDAVTDAIEELPEDEPLRVQLQPGALELGQLVPIAVDATYDGAVVSLFVEPAYLHDAIGVAPGPAVAIEVVDETHPLVVRTPGDDSYLAVVMPVLVRRPR